MYPKAGPPTVTLAVWVDASVCVFDDVLVHSKLALSFRLPVNGTLIAAETLMLTLYWTWVERSLLSVTEFCWAEVWVGIGSAAVRGGI